MNLKTDAFHCWVCGWGHKNSIEPILKLKRGSEYYAEYVSEHSRPKVEVLEDRKYDPIVLPKEFRSLSAPHRSPWFNQAMAYLGSRGLRPSDAFLYKLGYAEYGDGGGARIIIPSFDEYGEMNFITSRFLFPKPDAPKYKSGNFSKDIIFNDYMIDWEKPVTLVEGPFDMMKVGQNAIPLQGVELRTGSKLFHKIVERKVPVYVALDDDAMESILKIVDDLMRFGIDVSIVTWKGVKDPGDMPIGMFETYRKNAMRMSNSFDLLKYKVFNSASLR